MALNFANNNSLSEIDTKPSGLSGGTMNLISTQTASSSSTISFTSGIDSTYDEYVFKFYDIHPETNDVIFEFQGSTNSGSSYGVTITSTSFYAAHGEGDATAFTYNTYGDLAQQTSYQRINSGGGQGNGDDECFSGYLQIFNPSSSVFAKHFIIRGNEYNAGDYSIDNHVAGYFNTTSAVDAIQFKMNSGNFDGVIKLYGVS